MTHDQKVVATGAVCGVTAMIVALVVLYSLWPLPVGLATASDRLVYVVQANAIAVLPLLIAVTVVGNNRFLSEAIDSTLNKENLATLINGRVADNTLQQYVLFVAATFALSVNLPPDQMRIVPAAVVVFVVARFAFWVGYRIAPLYRAFGMAATAYLNVGLLGYAFWRMLAR